MFRVSQHPSSGVLKTVTAASGTGHNIGTATSFLYIYIYIYIYREREREGGVREEIVGYHFVFESFWHVKNDFLKYFSTQV